VFFYFLNEGVKISTAKISVLVFVFLLEKSKEQ